MGLIVYILFTVLVKIKLCSVPSCWTLGNASGLQQDCPGSISSRGFGGGGGVWFGPFPSLLCFRKKKEEEKNKRKLYSSKEQDIDCYPMNIWRFIGARKFCILVYSSLYLSFFTNFVFVAFFCQISLICTCISSVFLLLVFVFFVVNKLDHL